MSSKKNNSNNIQKNVVAPNVLANNPNNMFDINKINEMKGNTMNNTNVLKPVNHPNIVKNNSLNILSIDMDYILSPCINLYNDLVNANQNPTELWKKMNELRDLDKHISYDDKNLRFMFDVYINALSKLKNDNIMFALNHDAILYELASKKYEGKKFNLYNIDHHHDIFYSDEGKNSVDNFDVANVGTWVWYLDKHNKIDKYTWIRNENSILPQNNLTFYGKYETKTKEQALDILTINDWDFIFVCDSPHWFPKDYEVFFHMLKDAYTFYNGKSIKIEENIFCPAGVQRPYPYDKEK